MKSTHAKHRLLWNFLVLPIGCAISLIPMVIYEILINHTSTITGLASPNNIERPNLFDPLSQVFPLIFAIIGISISIIYFNLRIVYDVWTNFTNTHFILYNIILIIVADLAILCLVS